MDTTPNLALPYIAPQQAQKHVTHNEALRALDALAQLAVLSRTLAEPPASPAEGDRYIVPAGATAGWSGMDDSLAAFQDGAWAFYPPRTGWLAWVVDETALLAFAGTGDWIAAGVTSGVPLFGVNTDPDAGNRLAVKSDAVLFSHDDVTPGSGDQRTVINKQATAKTASLLLQTGWSGRAEFGTTGDDDVHLKVSPDGTAWHEALVVDGGTGRIAFPSGGVRELLDGDRTYYVDATIGADANDGLTPGTAFATVQKAVDTALGLDFSIHDVTIQLADGTYTAGAVFTGGWVGSGTLTIKGNSGDSSAVVISSTAANCIRNTGALSAVLTIREMTLTTITSGMCIGNEGAGQIDFTNIVFGGCAQYHLYANSPAAIVRAMGNYSISGNAQRHLDARFGGMVNVGGRIVTFQDDVNFAYQFAQSFILGTIVANGMTFDYGAHTVTGPRYSVSMNGTIYTGAGISYLPGDAAGITGTGGQYG